MPRSCLETFDFSALVGGVAACRSAKRDQICLRGTIWFDGLKDFWSGYDDFLANHT